MNAIFFGLKRAHQSSVRVTRNVLVQLGLTAARFDLLYVLLESPQLPIPQRDLRRTLGVTGPTVSRMLASLEQLGLVRRTRGSRDRRQRLVDLTTSGMRRIRRARAVVIRSGWAQLVVDTALGGERWWDLGYCFLRMDALEGMLRAVRHAYLDVGWVIYRWHPDE